jgi:hypothetical protein
MKILVLEREMPNVTVEQFQQYAVAEARQAWDLYQAGILREMYFRTDRDEAVLVLECESVNEAQSALSTLPFVQNKLIEFELIPLKAYPGFERLFTKVWPV